MKNILTSSLIVLLSLSIIFLGCGTSKTFQGGAIGAAAGGIIGGIIGKQAGNTAAGAILGAVVGGATGAVIGHYMDKQAEEMQKDLKGAKVERVGEGIKITFESGILFDVNKSELQPAAKSNIENLAKILNKYADTKIIVEGHTDSTGSLEHNQKLSEQRAGSVSNYLKTFGVQDVRISTTGYGPTQPVASNETADGRAQNRRVEVAIYANEKLKKAAESGEIK